MNKNCEKENKKMKLIYTAFSKKLFYFRAHISKFVLEKNGVPLNPFMIHEYFLLDTIDRDTIRESNNALVSRADELWVFGEISNGVASEIKLAKKQQKPIRYFTVIDSKIIKEIEGGKAVAEKE